MKSRVCIINSKHLTLNENQNITLIKDISEIEIKKAISKLKPNKSPGPDGFPSDWYKEMKELLIPLMRTSFNYILKTGVIPPSWNEASISLIAKEGKDRLDCGNYRPISVLNQDYKIFTYILAKRIENILAQIISLDQTGFIKQRQTQDNVRRTLHVIDYVGKNKIPMVLMSLDAEKAFNRVNWEFLYKVMGKFGFHQSFIRIIQALYKSPRARIKVNGALSNVFNLQRGTRQGCPLSPSLFALFIEALSQSVIQSNNITGVKIMGREHKISLFADDILIYLTNPNITFPKLLSLLETFGSLSGYKLNILKTQILTFNYKPNQEIKSKVNLNWESEWMKYLGVNITKDLSKLYNANFNPLCYKINEDIKRWNLLPFLNFESRIDTIKMNILPRMLYLFQTLPVEITDKQFQEWDKTISRFIWQGKKPRIKYQIIQLAKDKGGLGFPCLKDYYISAQFRILVCWCNVVYQARWKEIETETEALKDFPIQASLGDVRLIKKQINQGNQWINLPLKLWSQFLNKNDWNEEARILRWCAYDLDFLPNKLDARYKKWAGQGLMAYCMFYDKGILRDFQSLKDQYQLSKTDFFRFLQIRHHIHNYIPKRTDLFSLPVLNIFVKAYQADPGLKVISRLYKGIQEVKKWNTAYIKKKWERETNTEILNDIWYQQCVFQWRISSSNIWRCFGWKSLCRFFITPAQSKHYSIHSSCWRKCGAQGIKHFHLFWSCPLINTFWVSIHSELQIIFSMQLPFNWDELLFGYLYSVNVDKTSKLLYGILSLAARKTITKKWLSVKIPSLNDWYEIVYGMFKMERITFINRLQYDIFNDIWDKWKHYILSRRPDFV